MLFQEITFLLHFTRKKYIVLFNILLIDLSSLIQGVIYLESQNNI